MRPFPGFAWALAGAVLASTAIYVIPKLQPAHEAEDEEFDDADGVHMVGGGVTLDKAALAHAGIRLVPLHSATRASERTGFARALDLAPLAAINAEILASRAALSASEAESARQSALAAQDQSASVRAVEAARAQARADRARLSLALRRVGLEYGSGLAGYANGLDGLLAQAASGRAALVRLDFQDAPPPAGSHVRLSSGVEASAQVLGPATAADPNLQSAGVLAIVRGQAARALAVGRVVGALIDAPGNMRSGVLVPREAIVRTLGGLWAYRAERGGVFRRVELHDATAQDAGWFVSDGLHPGDRVVTAGSATLLGMEAGPPAEEE